MAEPTKALSPILNAASGSAAWEQALEFPCTLTADLALPHLMLRQLMDLKLGQIIDSHRNQGVDVPLQVNGRLIAWAEFEVVDQHLALRLTELA